MDENTLALAIAERPILHPRPGDDVLVHSRPDAPNHVVKVRGLVAFTRSWTTLELASFVVDTEEGEIRIRPAPDPDGLWVEIPLPRTPSPDSESVPSSSWCGNGG